MVSQCKEARSKGKFLNIVIKPRFQYHKIP
ncbi:hypothetical protein [Chryseobacterium soli]|nr:hypothetical protein [Chryseobacterium soli]